MEDKDTTEDGTTSSSSKKKAKSSKKKILKQTEYTIIIDEKTGEADLHFNLKNPIEDRYFAYALTLMDLHQTLEGVMKIAPPQVTADFITAMKVLKGMSESIKLKIEEEYGYAGMVDPDKKAQKERISKMLATIKEKLEKENPGTKVVIGRVSGKKGGSMEDALKEALEEMAKEISDDEGNEDDAIRSKPIKKKKSTSKLEENDIVKSKPAQDLEI